ncbi:hypothetical protein MHLP_01635 [Candidatus Mycoplasma haematolamae str. Purdue]|uniref:Uncharacterized protein n=1 Tax=Mycoplasma haematolamae (strain Purdue) TaxID=1212765 RepID=I7C5W6_MYCHA|nr:hypothetical protein [Candidatus Mycoplasma haematolamae]AFO51907.1 hypothetical protein MHLP_01635 [Candidatus Mycoplasma haematolamae str. Purdue]
MIFKKVAIFLGGSLGGVTVLGGTALGGLELADNFLSERKTYELKLDKENKSHNLTVKCPWGTILEDSSDKSKILVTCVKPPSTRKTAWSSLRIYNIEKAQCEDPKEPNKTSFSCKSEEYPFKDLKNI